MLQVFCETGTIENRERSGRPSKIAEEKIDEVLHVTENQQQMSELLQRFTLFPEQQHTELRNLTKLNLFKNLMRKTSRIELTCVKL